MGQILEERKACWDHTGQLLLLHLSNLREYNVTQRKLFNDHGQIQASLFYTKCEAVHELMLRDFSFLESLVLYGNLLEDLCHRVSLHFAGLSSEPGETNVDQVEQFIDVRQVEYLSLCDRVLLNLSTQFYVSSYVSILLAICFSNLPWSNSVQICFILLRFNRWIWQIPWRILSHCTDTTRCVG